MHALRHAAIPSCLHTTPAAADCLVLWSDPFHVHAALVPAASVSPNYQHENALNLRYRALLQALPAPVVQAAVSETFHFLLEDGTQYCVPSGAATPRLCTHFHRPDGVSTRGRVVSHMAVRSMAVRSMASQVGNLYALYEDNTVGLYSTYYRELHIVLATAPEEMVRIAVAPASTLSYFLLLGRSGALYRGSSPTGNYRYTLERLPAGGPPAIFTGMAIECKTNLVPVVSLHDRTSGRCYVVPVRVLEIWTAGQPLLWEKLAITTRYCHGAQSAAP